MRGNGGRQSVVLLSQFLRVALSRQLREKKCSESANKNLFTGANLSWTNPLFGGSQLQEQTQKIYNCKSEETAKLAAISSSPKQTDALSWMCKKSSEIFISLDN